MKSDLVVGTLLCALLTIPLDAQSDARPAFEVASVKPHKSTGPSTSNFPLGPGDAYTPNGGRFSATNIPLASYIAFAYRIMGDQADFFLKQLPGWVTAERFDMEARSKGNPNKDQMRLMMRSLLADRFKLAVHEENRETRIATLLVAAKGKLGPQLQQHNQAVACPTDPNHAEVSTDPRFPSLCGGFVGMPPTEPGRVRFGARNVTIDFIAKSLSGRLGSPLPILNRTDLDGTFDFSLEFTPEALSPVKPGGEAELDPTGPAFETALRQQLGLRLASQKGTVKVLVLDHVERPSEN